MTVHDNPDLRNLIERVGRLESWKEKYEAVEAERRKYMQAEFDRLNTKSDRVIADMRWLIGAIVVAVATQVVAYVFRGGMSLPGI